MRGSIQIARISWAEQFKALMGFRSALYRAKLRSPHHKLEAECFSPPPGFLAKNRLVVTFSRRDDQPDLTLASVIGGCSRRTTLM